MAKRSIPELDAQPVPTPSDEALIEDEKTVIVTVAEGAPDRPAFQNLCEDIVSSLREHDRLGILKIERKPTGVRVLVKIPEGLDKGEVCVRVLNAAFGGQAIPDLALPSVA